MPKRSKSVSPKKAESRRLSVTFSDEQLRSLEAIAKKNRVSVAWVIREAIDRLLRDDAPLFHLRPA
jgi:predicted DNA-binding protein